MADYNDLLETAKMVHGVRTEELTSEGSVVLAGLLFASAIRDVGRNIVEAMTQKK